MAMFTVEENAPSPKEFLSLRKSAGMGARSLEGAKKGLGNELYAVKLLENSTKKIVGMGRVVGDGGTVYHICDMVIHPEWQRHGGGTIIMNLIMKYISNQNTPDAYVNLMADIEGFYEKWDFVKTSPTSEGMYLKSK